MVMFNSTSLKIQTGYEQIPLMARNNTGLMNLFNIIVIFYQLSSEFASMRRQAAVYFFN